MLKESVLLDSMPAVEPSERMGKNAAFVHLFYCPVKTGNDVGIAKLYVVESYDDKKKFYLTKIESEYLDSTDEQTSLKSSKYPDTISVADLFDLVKQFDKDFHPGKEIDPIFLNDDGTPKVFYHGTDEDFTAFDITKSRSWDGAPDYDLPGFYFSESPEISGDYGEGVHAYYLTAERIWRTSKDGDLKSLQS